MSPSSADPRANLYQVYAPADLAFAEGEGVWLTGNDGKRYLDFYAGLAVNAFGHGHPRLLKALRDGASKPWHLSNLYRIPEQERLAEALCAQTFADRVFFTNSGAEAIECAIKTARARARAAGSAGKDRILAFDGAFHGRTLGAIAASGQAKMLAGFEPRLGGFVHVPFGDMAAAAAAMDSTICAILVEPIQGESGVKPLPAGALGQLRALADRHDALLIFDEIQCGFGRTGRLFAYEGSGVAPDILAVAKGLAGGFPIGACLATRRAAAGMVVGSHGSTFGGAPLACAVALEALAMLTEEGFLDHVARMGSLMGQGLEGLRSRHAAAIDLVRGEGLMWGIRLRATHDARALVAAARGHGVLLAPAGDNVVRLLPPLIIEPEHLSLALEALDAAIPEATAA